MNITLSWCTRTLTGEAVRCKHINVISYVVTGSKILRNQVGAIDIVSPSLCAALAHHLIECRKHFVYAVLFHGGFRNDIVSASRGVQKQANA